MEFCFVLDDGFNLYIVYEEAERCLRVWEANIGFWD